MVPLQTSQVLVASHNRHSIERTIKMMAEMNVSQAHEMKMLRGG